METLSAYKYNYNRQQINLHREEEGTENKAMETRQTSHTASFWAWN